MKHLEYQNYIFDLYGTLVDIRANERKAYLWQKMSLYMCLQGASYAPDELRREYARLTEEVRRNNQYALKKTLEIPESSLKIPGSSLENVESSLDEVIRQLYNKKEKTASLETIAAWALIFRTLSLEHLRLYEGAREMLEKLKNQGKHIYLLSNAQRLFTEPEVRFLGISDLFDDIFYSSDIGFAKPSPHFYGALLQKHKLDTATSVMVGNDPEADAWGAFHMGLDSMYIHTAQSPQGNYSLPPNCRQLKNIGEAVSYSSTLRL